MSSILIGQSNDINLFALGLWRNAPSTSETVTGVSSSHCGSSDTIKPEQVLRHHRYALKRRGGTGTVPTFIEPERCIEYHGTRNSPKPTVDF